MEAAEDIRLLADRLRVVAAAGLRHTVDDPYQTQRYEQVLRTAAELFSVVDRRDADEIERTVFRELTHVAPVPGVEAGVFDDEGRILLLQRSDDRLWAMPGGMLEVGETPAQGAAREAAEETGVVVEVLDLSAVYDSRFCGTRASLQLVHLVFHCRPVGALASGPTTPNEALDVGWFTEHSLPPLSPGHEVRVPHAFAFHRSPGPARFDRAAP